MLNTLFGLEGGGGGGGEVGDYFKVSRNNLAQEDKLFRNRLSGGMKLWGDKQFRDTGTLNLQDGTILLLRGVLLLYITAQQFTMKNVHVSDFVHA